MRLWLQRFIIAVFGFTFIVSIAQGYIKKGIDYAFEKVWVRDQVHACIGNMPMLEPPRDNYAFTVAVTHLSNDPHHRQFQIINDSLRSMFQSELGSGALRMVAVPCELIDQRGDVSASIQNARGRAEYIANFFKADLVIWGEIRSQPDIHHLHFTHSVGSEYRSFLAENFNLGPSFNESIGAFVAATAMNYIELLAGDRLVVEEETLWEAFRVTENLVRDRPINMRAMDRGYLFQAHAHCLAFLGAQTASREHLQLAADFYDHARAAFSEAEDVRYEGRSLVHRGQVLRRIGASAGDHEFLIASIGELDKALEILTREFSPHDWAAAQNSLGTTLATRGEINQDEALLNQAIVAFQSALEVQQKDSVPYFWANTQANLGTALMSLGILMSEEEILRRSVIEFGYSFEVFTRNQYPVDWANTHNSLGIALRHIGELTSEVAYLERAVASFRSALEIRSKNLRRVDWVTTQMNLGGALARLGEFTEDVVLLGHAVQAFEDASEALPRDGQALRRAMLHENIARAGLSVFRLNEDDDAIRKSLERLNDAIGTFYVLGAEVHLARANSLRSEIITAMERQ